MLKFTELAVKDAEEQLKHFESTKRDMEDQIQRAIGPTIKVVKEIEETRKHPFGDIKITPAVLTSHPVTTQELGALLKKYSRPTAQTPQYDVFYNKTDKTLRRKIADRQFVYKFGKGKRFSLITELIDLDPEKFKPTSILAKLLKCPTNNAIQKLAGAINKKAKFNLGLPRGINFIEGRDGLGYRIDPQFVVHKDKL